jgi:rhodanese-related sulfurtransferase
MKPYENLHPSEAWERIDQHGWTHIDVRTTQEFDEGHAPGAYNVPLLHFDPLRGRKPNERFVEIIERHFDRDTPLIVSCAHAHRSVAACQALIMAGFTRVANCDGGYFGRSGFDGRIQVPGWIDSGLPVVSNPEEGRDFRALEAAKERLSEDAEHNDPTESELRHKA